MFLHGIMKCSPFQEGGMKTSMTMMTMTIMMGWDGSQGAVRYRAPYGAKKHEKVYVKKKTAKVETKK